MPANHDEQREFVICPYEGYGPIRFGMSRADVAEIFGSPDDELWGSRYVYHDMGLFVDFDGADRHIDVARGNEVQFVEVAPPGVPILDGLRLVGSRAPVLGMLAEAGYELQHGDAHTGDADSTYVLGRGTVVWCEDNQVGTVGAWRRGYWSSAPAGPDE